MIQTELFVTRRHGEFSKIEPTAPYVRRSATSRAAAVAIDEHTDTIRERVFDFISAQGVFGATRDEVELALHLSGNTVRPRVKELLRANRVKHAGLQRNTRSGRRAEVLTANLE